MEEWDLMCKRNGWNSVDMRDNRYDHVIHMVRWLARGEEVDSHGSWSSLGKCYLSSRDVEAA